MLGMKVARTADPSLGIRNRAPAPRWQRWSEGEAVTPRQDRVAARLSRLRLHHRGGVGHAILTGRRAHARRTPSRRSAVAAWYLIVKPTVGLRPDALRLARCRFALNTLSSHYLDTSST